MSWEKTLVGGWTVEHPIYYVLAVFGFSACVRALMACLKALRPGCQDYSGLFLCRTPLRLIGAFLHNCGREFWPHLNFDLDPTILGTLELVVYRCS